MFVLHHAMLINIQVGDYTSARADADALAQLTAEKDAPWWRASEMFLRGYLLTFVREASDAIDAITTGLAASQPTKAWVPLLLIYLAKAHSEMNEREESLRGITEAMTKLETTKEKWCEAEVHRIAGEIALKSPQPDAAKAQAYCERALTVARQQQAKSWELRAAMSMARLWRDQEKRKSARELLAPVYGWFTEGFDTRDLKEAKVLLDELAG